MKHKLQFTLAYPLLVFISILPFGWLYFFSDFLFFALYRCLGYRKAVVRKNLSLSFPDKTRQELRIIEKKFYQNFTDLLLEVIKIRRVNIESIINRCAITNLSIYEHFHQKNKSVIALMGHTGNWEWASIVMRKKSPYQLNVVYKNLDNSAMNQLLFDARNKFGAYPIAMQHVYKELLSQKEALSVTALLADQAPNPKIAHWTSFLNQETPFFNGAIKIAKKLNYPILFVNVRRVKRGHYVIDTEVLVEQPADQSIEDMVELYVRKLEQTIERNPDQWLWSHKRWKHKKEEHVRL